MPVITSTWEAEAEECLGNIAGASIKKEEKKKMTKMNKQYEKHFTKKLFLRN